MRRAALPALLGVLLRGPLPWAEGVRVELAPWCVAGSLRWSIADSDGSPDILSELTWERLQFLGLEGEIAFPLRGRLEIRVSAAGAWAARGGNQDSDYGADGRKDEWSRSQNDAAGSVVWSLCGALGYRVEPAASVPRVVLLFGLAVTQWYLRMTDGYQALTGTSPEGDDAPPVGPIEGLDSRYVATWGGPWIGAELEVALARVLRAQLAGRVQLLGYYAWADWNLRDDFEHPRSFDHRSWGCEGRASVSVEGRLGPRLLLVARAEATTGAVAAGRDRTFLADGREGFTRLNGVRWQSLAAGAGLVLLL